MNTANLIKIMKMGHITIPMFLLRNYQKLGINLECLVLLSYLLNKDKLSDYKKIAHDLNINEKKVLEYINELQEKGVLNICVEKNDKGVVEEYISVDALYSKLSLIMLDDLNDEEESNIYQMFEEEFGRTLSPMEYEIITGWLDSKYSEEIIIQALKEAVYNGASNLRYIDKILFEWQKKGIKKVSDVYKEKERFAKAKDKKIEVPDYNWLEEDE